MSLRFVLIVILAELVLAAPLAYWLMWQFAFKGLAAYHIGNTLIAATFAAPIVIGLGVQWRRGKLWS